MIADCLSTIILVVVTFLFSLYYQFTYFESVLLSFIAGYLPSYLNDDHLKDGRLTPSFQRLQFWKLFREYVYGRVTVEEPLNHDQLYIFCSFPHGACNA